MRTETMTSSPHRRMDSNMSITSTMTANNDIPVETEEAAVAALNEDDPTSSSSSSSQQQQQNEDVAETTEDDPNEESLSSPDDTVTTTDGNNNNNDAAATCTSNNAAAVVVDKDHDERDGIENISINSNNNNNNNNNNNVERAEGAGTETKQEGANNNEIINERGDEKKEEKETEREKECRDASICSRNTRDSLRRQVSIRSHTFTEVERLFLEQLSLVGTDREVALALRTIQNEDLFFEHDTPTHNQQQYEKEHTRNNSLISDSSSFFEDDATREGAAPSIATVERKGLGHAESSSSLTTSLNKSTNERNVSSSSLPSPSIPPVIIGSKRRYQVLQRRKSDTTVNLTKLWKAHETGLSVTANGSVRSILRRESSMGSVMSNMSGLSVLFGKHPHPGAAQHDVFRSSSRGARARRGSGSSFASCGSASASMFLTTPPRSNKTHDVMSMAAQQNNTNLLMRTLPSMPRKISPHRRSKSVNLSSLLRGSSGGGGGGGQNASSVYAPPQLQQLRQNQREQSLPQIPEPRSFSNNDVKESNNNADPRSMFAAYGRTRSVTFRDFDEQLEYDTEKDVASISGRAAGEDSEVSTTEPKRTTKIIRRAVSDSYLPSLVKDDNDEPEQQQQQQEMTQQQTKQQQMVLLQRREMFLQRESSNGTVPSLHHGWPLRESSASIPSLHQGHPLDSMSSIPSLHHGQPLRDSISSIPSLHYGTPIRSDSSFSTISNYYNSLQRNSSVASMNLHRATPIRQDSQSTIPSLHHGKPIRQDSIKSINTIDTSASMSREQMIQQFGVAPEIASAWVQLEGSCDESLPLDEQLLKIQQQQQNDELDDKQVDDASKEGENDSPPKPIYLRQASQNDYEGEGIEATELIDDSNGNGPPLGSGPIIDDCYDLRRPYPLESGYTPGFPTAFWNNDIVSIRTANSFDDSSIYSSQIGRQQRTSDVFRNLRRSLSDDNMSTLFLGPSKEILLNIPPPSSTNNSITGGPIDDDYEDISDEGGSTSWEMEFASPPFMKGGPGGRFDAWNILQDEYVNGYGGGGTLGFKILGTSLEDESARPHVLSPPLMESLQAFLPTSKSGENFYLKYSMVRDGAYLPTLLKRARGVKYSILAIETIDGEVFGSFTGEPWRKSWNYFGLGYESFLWKMRRSRLEEEATSKSKQNGILEQAQKESEIDVYPYTGENGFIQLCTHDRLAVGGGMPDPSFFQSTTSEASAAEKKMDEPNNSSSGNRVATDENYNPLLEDTHQWGFGLALQSDLLQGSSSPCITFGSPSLCKKHSDGSLFEIMNIELWTTTPCMTEEDAEKLTLSSLFLQDSSDYNSNRPNYNYNAAGTATLPSPIIKRI